MAQKSAAIDPRIAEATIASQKQLAEEQKNAVRHLTAAPDASQIACMTGKAGTGKSTTLDTCRRAWETADRALSRDRTKNLASDLLDQAPKRAQEQEQARQPQPRHHL